VAALVADWVMQLANLHNQPCEALHLSLVPSSDAHRPPLVWVPAFHGMNNESKLMSGILWQRSSRCAKMITSLSGVLQLLTIV
jgi:hypothetical protein